LHGALRVRLECALAAVLFLGAGCSVPNITLVPDDAAGGGGDAQGADGGGDGAGDDDSGDAAGSGDDGGSDGAGCPGSAPEGGTCCGNVACSGDCSDASCASCITKCTDTQLCCVKAQSVTCHSLGTTCP
jgi:hypothetical protein